MPDPTLYEFMREVYIAYLNNIAKNHQPDCGKLPCKVCAITAFNEAEFALREAPHLKTLPTQMHVEAVQLLERFEYNVRLACLEARRIHDESIPT